MVSSLDNWDGSLSSAAKKNATRITESAGASSLNKTATVQDPRIAVGIGHGWHDVATHLDGNHTYNASIVNQPISRDVNAQFTPISSSPLHIVMPVQTSMALTVPSLVSSTLPPIHMDALETISTHTADGDGEEVDISDVTDMLGPYSSPSYHEQIPSAPSCDSPLFTPPPEVDARSIHHSSPSPSPKQTQPKPSSVFRKPRSRRLIMSHIEVPPLKRPRSDYRPDYRPAPSTLSTIVVSKRRVAPNPLQEALQASLQHNEDVGVFLGGLNKQKRKLMKKRRDGNADIVAGPSSVSHPSGTKNLKRLFMDDNDDWGPTSRHKKRPRPISEPMVVDLTITDDDDHAFPPPRATSSSTKESQNPRPKVKPTPQLPISKPISKPRPLKKPKFIHAQYNSKTDVVTLCLEDIRPVPLEILTLNTRSLRQLLGSDVSADKDDAFDSRYNSVDIDCTRQNGSRPCLAIIECPSTKDSGEEVEVSVGGDVRELLEEWVEKEVIEISSESDALKENVPQKIVPVPTLLVPTLKDQHQKKPRGFHIKPKQRHHSTDDDVSRSSSTFKAPLGVAVSSRPAPSAIADTTQYPRKKVREPQPGQQQQPRKEKQTLSKGIRGSSTIPAHIFSPKVKLAQQHPKKLLESQLIQDPRNDSPVRPPQSARSSLNGQILGSESEIFSGPMPSAKALGKRRAISPMSISATTTTTAHQHPHFPFTPYSAGSVLSNNDFNAVVNYPTAMSPAVQSSSAQANGANSINTFALSNSYHPLDTLTSLFDQAASSSRNQSEKIHIGSSDIDSSRHTSTHSHILAYDSRPQSGSGSRGESYFSSTDFLYDDVGLPGDQHDDHQYDQEPQRRQQYDTAVDDAWSSSLVGNQPEAQYAYETIDPTLLGGGAEAESELEPDLAVGMDVMDDAEADVVGGMEAGSDDQVRQKDNNNSQGEVDTGLSNESSSTDSRYSPASSKPKKPSKAEETFTRKLPPRNRRKRVMPDMISHEDIDLMSKRRKAEKNARIRLLSVVSSASSALDGDKSSSSSSEAGNGDDDDDDDDDESDDEKMPITIRKPILRASRGEWLMDDVESFCHQCRRKTFYAKMTCSDCQKKYCTRCYTFRYPECEFDADDEEYSCPSCEGFCNCTVCCRKRGEAYVGVRTCDKSPPPPPSRPQRPRNANNERVKLGAKTNLVVAPAPPPLTTKIPTTTIPKGATNAWGSLYSVTGEKIGACFFDPSAEKESSMVFAPATTPIMTTMNEVAQQQQQQQQVATAAAPPPPTIKPKVIKVKRKKKYKRRIFIGIVQDCWGYTRPRVRQVEAEPYSKRSYNSMPRYYIGKKKYLFYPVEEDESSLTAMDESDEALGLDLDGIDVDIEGKTFFPDSLGDGDVTRAIFLGLAACGFAAVPAI